MSTLFTKIIDGEVPGRFLWADEQVVSFLTVGPIRPGHALVVPRDEIDQWIDADDDLLARLTAVAKRIGQAQQAVWDPPRIGTMIAGFEVPHLHVHVWPVYHLEDFSFERVDPDPDPSDLDRAAEQIRVALDELGDGEHIPVEMGRLDD